MTIGVNLMIALIPVVLIIIGLAGYYLFYKKEVNKSLNREGSRRHLISPGDVGIYLLLIFFVISNVRNNATISSLQSQLNNMNSQLTVISQKIDYMSEDHHHDFDWSMTVKELYKENDHYIAKVKVEIVPEVIDSATKAELYVEDKKVELTMQNYHYTGEFEMDTLKFPQSCYVYLENENGGVREDLYFEPEKLYSQLLPSMLITGSTTITSNKLVIDDVISVFYSDGGTYKFSSAEYVITDRNEVIHSQKLDVNNENTVKFSDSISKEENVRIYINAKDIRGWKYVYAIKTINEQYLLIVTDETGQIVIRY